MRTWGHAGGLILVIAIVVVATATAQRPFERIPVASSHELKIGGSTLQVDFAPGQFDLGDAAILRHVQTAATAVTAYYGRFPVPRARVLIIPVEDRAGVLQGTTWGGMGGWPGFTRMRIGQHTTQAELDDDWMMTHELVHLALPSLPDDEHWMEEGLATYVEPLARVMTGNLEAKSVWHDMVRDMPKGEPQPGDEGLNHTHTWGRTYWGGALFCLVADVNIRKETHNSKGLRDALRAIMNAGGIDHDEDLEQALEAGDRATGTQVLTGLYAAWKDKPVTVDLDKLWSELGVRSGPDGVQFVSSAPLAKVRQAIAGKPAGVTPAAARH
ncbi:MAG TPA: hypothetical protein VG267_04560 [Terracidiphilus sp.]|jgi:hypothetical protein|nr:hypothetical protein [Terracidiphilus sp.]